MNFMPKIVQAIGDGTIVTVNASSSGVIRTVSRHRLEESIQLGVFTQSG